MLQNNPGVESGRRHTSNKIGMSQLLKLHGGYMGFILLFYMLWAISRTHTLKKYWDKVGQGEQSRSRTHAEGLTLNFWDSKREVLPCREPASR